MNKPEREALITELSDLHWTLWRLHTRLERGSHRNCVASADDHLITILRDLLEQQPKLVGGMER